MAVLKDTSFMLLNLNLNDQGNRVAELDTKFDFLFLNSFYGVIVFEE